MKIPLHKMSVQNINENMKEGCRIITSKQLPETLFNRLVIKKSVIDIKASETSLPLHESVTFFLTSKILNLD